MAKKTLLIEFTGKADKLQTALMKVQRGITGMADSAGNKISATAIKMGGLEQKVKKVDSAAKRASAGFKMLGSALQNAAKFAQGAVQGFLNLVNGVRQLALGITNIGRSMMFFVSLPIVAAFKSMSSAAMDFESAMANVARTTGMVGERAGELDVLSAGIRDYANNTATPLSDLTNVLMLLGQAGIEGGDALLSYAKIFDILAVGTDTDSDVIANAMIKIANAFGWDMSDSAEDIWALSNVINVVAKKTSANAEEILAAMTDFAGVATMMGLVNAENKKGAATVVALGGTLVSLGFSANEAGTALQRMFTNLAENAGTVSTVMKDLYEGYDNVDQVLQRLNADPMQVVNDILEATKESSNNAKDLVTLMEIADVRGGRALAALAGGEGMLGDVIAMANKEWEERISLLADYERQMQTTEASIGMLKNNIQDAAITLGSTFLPVINNMVQMVVPAIRAVVKWFESLTESQKMMGLGIVALLAVAGPLLMFLGQFAYGIMSIVMGVGTFVKSILGLVVGLGKVISMLGGVSGIMAAITSPIGLAVAAVLALVGAFALVGKALQRAGIDIAGVFTRIADAAKSWGTRLAATYANGFLAGAAKFIAKAIEAVARMIARFFEAHSPPEAGPLATIDKWGVALMGTYLRGFKLADFSILSDVGKIIEQELTRGIPDDVIADALGKTAKAREILAKLIDMFNKTGEVSSQMMDDAMDGVGYLSEDVKKLIKLWLEYNAIQERLAKLEERRKNTLKSYESSIEAIGASGGTALEKAESIRAAMRARDKSLKQIEKEKAGLEEQADAYKQQMEYQKEFIAAIQEQEDLMARIAEALEKVSDAMGGMDIGFEISDLAQSLSKAGGAVGEGFEITMPDRFKKGEAMWQAFLAGLTGEELEIPVEFDTPEDRNLLESIFGIGEKLAPVYTFFDETLPGWWDTISGFFEDVKSFTMPEIKMPEWLTTFIDRFSPVVDLFKSFIDNIMPTLQPSLDQLSASWDKLMVAIEPLLPIFAEVGKILLESIGVVLAAIIIPIIIWFISMLGGLIEWLIQFVSGIISAFSGLVTWISGVIDLFKNVFALIVGVITGDGEGIKSAFQGIVDAVATIWTGIITFLSSIFTTIFSSIWAFITGFWSTFITFIGGIIGYFDEAIGQFFVKIGEWIGSIGDSIVTWFNDAIDKAQGLVSLFFETGANIINGLIDGAKQYGGNFIDAITGPISDAIDKAKKLLGISSPSKVFEYIAKMSVEGYEQGTEMYADEGSSSVAKSMAAMATGFFPLDPLMAGGYNNTSYGGASTTINVNRDAVRSDQDIDELALAIERALNRKARSRVGYSAR